MFWIRKPISLIEPLDLKQRLDRGDKLVLLDVREDREVKACSLPGITHIPLGEIAARLHELNPTDEIVCICHLGQRSKNAAKYLIKNGFSRVCSLNGGMAAYVQQTDSSRAIE